jgi:hypothetical protein
MEANASALISFISIALALLILWLAYVVVRVWLEARNAFLHQYQQQGRTAEPVGDERLSEPSDLPEGLAPQRRCEPGE